MAGYFPVMMFGLPAACLAVYRAAESYRGGAVPGSGAHLAYHGHDRADRVHLPVPRAVAVRGPRRADLAGAEHGGVAAILAPLNVRSARAVGRPLALACDPPPRKVLDALGRAGVRAVVTTAQDLHLILAEPAGTLAESLRAR